VGGDTRSALLTTKRRNIFCRIPSLLSLFKYNYSFSDRFRDGQYSFVGCFSTYGAPVPYEIGSGAKMTETSTFNSL